jgi:uncharacterized protein YhbP (UPF0306 family)
MPDLAPLLALLDAHHVAHLATAGDGGPHAAPVFFARLDDGAAITWISAPHVLHSRHLAANGAAAASVGPSAPPLGLIEGAQLRGYAHAPDAEQDTLRAAWLARFPAASRMVTSAPDHRFYVLRPTWARLVRTVAGASQNREWDFP